MNLPLKVALGAATAMVIVGTLLPRGLMPGGNDVAPPVAAAATKGEPDRRVAPLASGASATLEADSAGHFHAETEIEGRVIPMLVDTGASIVALTAEDALRIGLQPMPSDYTIQLSTANGITTAAEVRLREIRIGAIVARDVSAVVMRPGLLAQSLLGMSFLKTIGHVDMGSRQLVLRQ